MMSRASPCFNNRNPQPNHWQANFMKPDGRFPPPYQQAPIRGPTNFRFPQPHQHPVGEGYLRPNQQQGNFRGPVNRGFCHSNQQHAEEYHSANVRFPPPPVQQRRGPHEGRFPQSHQVLQPPNGRFPRSRQEIKFQGPTAGRFPLPDQPQFSSWHQADGRFPQPDQQHPINSQHASAVRLPPSNPKKQTELHGPANDHALAPLTFQEASSQQSGSSIFPQNDTTVVPLAKCNVHVPPPMPSKMPKSSLEAVSGVPPVVPAMPNASTSNVGGQLLLPPPFFGNMPVPPLQKSERMDHTLVPTSISVPVSCPSGNAVLCPSVSLQPHVAVPPPHLSPGSSTVVTCMTTNHNAGARVSSGISGSPSPSVSSAPLPNLPVCSVSTSVSSCMSVSMHFTPVSTPCPIPDLSVPPPSIPCPNNPIPAPYVYAPPPSHSHVPIPCGPVSPSVPSLGKGSVSGGPCLQPVPALQPQCPPYSVNSQNHCYPLGVPNGGPYQAPPVGNFQNYQNKSGCQAQDMEAASSALQPSQNAPVSSGMHQNQKQEKALSKPGFSSTQPLTKRSRYQSFDSQKNCRDSSHLNERSHVRITDIRTKSSSTHPNQRYPEARSRNTHFRSPPHSSRSHSRESGASEKHRDRTHLSDREKRNCRSPNFQKRTSSQKYCDVHEKPWDRSYDSLKKDHSSETKGRGTSANRSDHGSASVGSTSDSHGQKRERRGHLSRHDQSDPSPPSSREKRHDKRECEDLKNHPDDCALAKSKSASCKSSHEKCNSHVSDSNENRKNKERGENESNCSKRGDHPDKEPYTSHSSSLKRKYEEKADSYSNTSKRRTLKNDNLDRSRYSGTDISNEDKDTFPNRSGGYKKSHERENSFSKDSISSTSKHSSGDVGYDGKGHSEIEEEKSLNSDSYKRKREGSHFSDVHHNSSSNRLNDERRGRSKNRESSSRESSALSHKRESSSRIRSNGSSSKSLRCRRSEDERHEGRERSVTKESSKNHGSARSKERGYRRSRFGDSSSDEDNNENCPAVNLSSLNKFYAVEEGDPPAVKGTDGLAEIHKRFQYELVERAQRVWSTKPKYEPPKRKIKLKKPKPPKGELADNESSSSFTDESSSEEEDTALEELERKKKHPDRLHEELWYNDPGEMNDGPLCRCSAKASRSGIRHGIYAGETGTPRCDPKTNNTDRLYHYSIVVKPDTNFLSRNPTKIKWNDDAYMFEGFSMFTHSPLAELPECKVIRFNIEYTILYKKEEFPKYFTVEGLELFSQYLFVELLELADLNWKAHGDPDGCPRFHFFPRFVRMGRDDDKEKQLLPMVVVLQYLLDSNQLLVEEKDLAYLKSLGKDQWPQLANKVKGMIVTCPGQKPSSIRVDQLDCEECDPVEKVFPVIIHFGVRPPQLSYAGNPSYQKAWRDYVKFRHLLANKPKVRYEDRRILMKKERRLQDMRLKNNLKRDVTVVVSSKNFYKTGIMCDVVQHAMLLPVLVCHLRFHLSLDVLEDKIKYKFKDRYLLQLALTHPSYRENFGTNPDHARNSLTNCGIRQPEYGDRRIHYVTTRKRGINTLINIMSRFGRPEATASRINHNERLEFLGDAVVEFLSSIHLFFMFPNLEEGGLATYRAAIVQNQHLAVLAKKLQLEKFMLYAHGSDLCHDLELKHAMANCFEALMGALFLDSGIEVADRVFSETLFTEPELLDVWVNYPLHPLQEQEPGGDRKWIESVPLLQKLHKFEEAIGIEFTHIRLLARALTHRSLGFNNLTLGSNQRLEFLGDTVLQLVASEYLYKFFPEHHEGHLSLLRSSLVNNRTQAVVCDDLGMVEYAIYPYSKVELKPKDRADLLEAFLGALYVDKDLGYCANFCEVCFFPRLQDFIMNQEWNDPKSKLQQCCLTLRTMDGGEPDIPVYKVIECKGPTNTRVYTVAVYFRGKRLAVGSGHSIQQAEMAAAENALKSSKSLFPQLDHQRRAIEKSLKQRTPSNHRSSRSDSK